MKFLKLLLRRRVDYFQQSQPLWIVLDGHTAHHAELNGVLHLMKSQTVIKPWFTPRAASWLNSAEWVNAHVKRKLSKVFALSE